MVLRQLRITLGHFYIRVAQDLCQLVKVATVHHVPRCKRVAQIVETKVFSGGISQYSMGNCRPQLKLMPEKLLLIREHLNVSQPVMAQLLELPKTGRVS